MPTRPSPPADPVSIFLARFRWYRRLVGGTWTRVVDDTPTTIERYPDVGAVSHSWREAHADKADHSDP